MTKTIPLSPDQIKAWEELHADLWAVDDQYKLTMNYYHNCKGEQYKRQQKFWNELAGQLLANLDTQQMTIKTINGAICVVITDRAEGRNENLANSTANF